MKTTNNVRKTNLKKMVAAGLTILTLSTYAQMATMPNLELDAKNQFALATVNKTPATTGFNTASFNAYLEPAREESLPVEPWMTNEKNFESAAINALEPAAEEELNIESWMLKEENFNEKEIKKAVREGYARIAKKESSWCGRRKSRSWLRQSCRYGIFKRRGNCT